MAAGFFSTKCNKIQVYNNYSKYLLHILNLSHVILGIFFIIAGVHFLDELPDFSGDKYSLNLHVVPIVCPVIGGIIFLVSCIGSIAVFMQKNTWIIIYTHLMFLILILLIALSIFIGVIVSRQGLYQFIEHIAIRSWRDVPDFEGWPFIDHLQNKFECCGITDYTDYHSPMITIRNSCCGLEDHYSQECEPEVYFKRPGCGRKMFEFWTRHAKIVMYYSIGIVLVEFIAIFLAWTIQIGNNYKGIRPK